MDTETFEDAVRALIDRAWVGPTVARLAESAGESGSHGFGHLLRVLRNAARIRDGEEAGGATVDWEVVAAAALLHDLVDLPKDHPERHRASTRSARAAVAHYRALGAFDDQRLEAIAHAIEAHSFSADVPATSLEAQILTDADRLESLGAFGLARVFYVSAELGGRICQMGDPFADARPLDDLQYAVDHFFTKLFELRDRIYTATGRQMADQRHRYMEGFLEQLADEIGVELPVRHTPSPLGA